MKRNQLSAIAQVKKMLNEKVCTFSEIRNILNKYFENCGLEYNIEYDTNELFFDVLNIEIVDFETNYSDVEIENGYNKRYISCYYIVDDECINHMTALCGAHNVDDTDRANFSDFEIENEVYSGSEKTAEYQVNKSQSWHIERDKDMLLVSYNTIIAYYSDKHNCIYFTPNAYKHSVTTNRHISQFLQEFDTFTRKKFARIGG